MYVSVFGLKTLFPFTFYEDLGEDVVVLLLLVPSALQFLDVAL